MFVRKTFPTATGHDAEAIARVKGCRLWSHVDFVFRDDRDVRGRLGRIATALFRASEVERNLTFCVRRIERLAGHAVIHWIPPGPPPGWISLVNAEFRAAGEPTPAHYSSY